MPSPSDDVRAAVRAIMQDWVDASPEAIERFLSAVAPDFTGHGTGPGDYYADPAGLRAMVEREHAGMSYPFTLDIPRLDVRMLAPEAAVAEGRIRVTIDVDGESVVEAPRFTFGLRRENGRWMLVHFHFSIPDAMQEEGGTMDDLLKSRNEQLEAEIERRTEELREAQAQLVQQEKLASLGALTAGIAHEIKNPLNFVTNFASLSRELVQELAEETDPEEREAILDDLRVNAEKIETHGRRADGIVRSMMAHARSRPGDRKTVDVNALVSEYTDLAWHGLKARAPSSDLDVDRQLAADAGVAEVSPPEIGRLLINLLDNAFDAVRARARVEDGFVPRVRISTERREEHVVIRVEDNGPGIPEAVRARVFEPFFTTKPTGEGTGLGLSLSHDIALAHHGTLAVETPEGGGTAFVLTLPTAS